MPAPGVAIALAGRVGGFLARKITKKSAKKVIGGVVAGLGVEKLLGKGGGGGGGINFPTSISPFDPRGGGVLQRAFGGGGGRGRVPAGDMGACPKGYHLNKHTLSDGTPARSVCVRNRSINYANGRAARRAGRRLRGTVKMLKKSFSLVSAKPAKGKFIPRRK